MAKKEWLRDLSSSLPPAECTTSPTTRWRTLNPAIPAGACAARGHLLDCTPLDRESRPKVCSGARRSLFETNETRLFFLAQDVPYRRLDAVMIAGPQVHPSLTPDGQLAASRTGLVCPAARSERRTESIRFQRRHTVVGRGTPLGGRAIGLGRLGGGSVDSRYGQAQKKSGQAGGIDPGP